MFQKKESRTVDLDGLNKVGQLLLVLGTDLSQSQSSGSLLVDNSSQSGFALDDAVGDTHFAAKGREPDNDFDRVNVVANDNELSLLGLNEGGNVVDTVLDDNRLLALVNLFTGSNFFGSSSETGLLLDRGLGAILVQELKKVGGSVLVQSL